MVLSTIGPGQEKGVVVRFGDQKMGNNYSPEARKAFKSRHAKNIKRKGSAAYGLIDFYGKQEGTVNVHRRVKRRHTVKIRFSDSLYLHYIKEEIK